MPNRIAEYIVFQTLKQCRAEMVQGFLDHKPEIYIPSYRHESSDALLKLSREKYFITWLGSHWLVFDNIIQHFHKSEYQEAETLFSKVFIKLLNSWLTIDDLQSSKSRLSLYLVEDMRVVLKKFIEAGEKSDAVRNKLQLAMEKNNRLFDREISKARGGLLL